MAKGKVTLTVDDVIATLKNSNLPSVIVEGSDDIVVFRRLEEKFERHFVSVLPVGGQDKVLEVFKRRGEFTNARPIAFVIDRDRWVFDPLPRSLIDPNLILTDGYSIENDVIRDGDFLNLMSTQERVRFNQGLDLVAQWFALAMSRFLHGYPEPLSLHPTQLFEHADLDAQLVELIINNDDSRLLLDIIITEPFKFLRGKTLLSLIMMQLSYKGRLVHHQPLALLDLIAAKPGPYLTDLFSRIQRSLGIA